MKPERSNPNCHACHEGKEGSCLCMTANSGAISWGWMSQGGPRAAGWCCVSAHLGHSGNPPQPLEQMMCSGSWQSGYLQHSCASLNHLQGPSNWTDPEFPHHTSTWPQDSPVNFFPPFWSIFFHTISPISMNEKYFPCIFRKALFWYVNSNINSTFQSSRISLKNVTLT